MFTLATHPGYRGRGIGKNLVIESLKLAKQVNCSAAIVLATNDFSRMIFNKIGMKIIATKNWEDCIHNGKRKKDSKISTVLPLFSATLS